MNLALLAPIFAQLHLAILLARIFWWMAGRLTPTNSERLELLSLLWLFKRAALFFPFVQSGPVCLPSGQALHRQKFRAATPLTLEYLPVSKSASFSSSSASQLGAGQHYGFR